MHKFVHVEDLTGKGQRRFYIVHGRKSAGGKEGDVARNYNIVALNLLRGLGLFTETSKIGRNVLFVHARQILVMFFDESGGPRNTE